MAIMDRQEFTPWLQQRCHSHTPGTIMVVVLEAIEGICVVLRGESMALVVEWGDNGWHLKDRNDLTFRKDEMDSGSPGCKRTKHDDGCECSLSSFPAPGD